SVAKAKSSTTIALTGPNGGQMAQYANVAIRVPGNSTKIIQEYHQSVWHTLCAMIENHFFPEKR
ncbi:MAG: phosphoheptose isomerase, partial [Candidatus Hydrogenedentes bacterium]|nr:phosphoheptose isomerase [Candidatus Hydrogenedentota bacterium]